jgi:CheY-like chemotaxis protein
MGISDALIIVAEDDALTRLVIAGALVSEGFEVIEAGHADDAIVHLEMRGQDVRVLFTDVQMPGEMDGVRLAHHVRSRWPQIGVIVTSGQALPQLPEMPPGSKFVPKPYEPEHVIAHVRALVAA